MHIQSMHVNDALIEICRALKKDSVTRTVTHKKPAGGESALVIIDEPVVVTLKCADNRHVSLPQRKYNIFAQIAEIFWVLAGHDKISPWLERFLPRAANFSDDGLTWRAAYGPRLYSHNQLDAALKELKSDLHSRRAVVSIYDPSRDTLGVSAPSDTKDVPCNTILQFQAVKGNESDEYYLDLHVFNRSNDVIWGFSGINVAEFSVIQEIMAALLGISPGYYHHYSTCMHYYESIPVAKKQVDEIADKAEKDTEAYNDTYPMMDLGYVDSWILVKELMGRLIEVLIEGGNYCDLLRSYEIYESSIIWTYAGLLDKYLKNEPINIGSYSEMPNALRRALEVSSFLPGVRNE